MNLPCPESCRRHPTAHAVGRFADVHMWRICNRSTSRLQAFRDGDGRGVVLITKREGDTGPSPVNHAEKFRDSAWQQFFPLQARAPRVVFNLLDPFYRWNRDRPVIVVSFRPDGVLVRSRDATDHELFELNCLGAEWGDGDGYVPHLPPDPTHGLALRRCSVQELPESNPFREMRTYLEVDWAHAVSVALAARFRTSGIGQDVPNSVAQAARSLWCDPIHLTREPARPLLFANGQHRAEALRRQCAPEAIVEEIRLISDPQLPGELDFRVLQRD